MTRAVFCAGGGVLGAFEAGVLVGLAGRGIAFDIAAGISTGSLQAVMVAQGQIEALEAIWRSITGSGDIYTYWPGRFLGSVLGWVKSPFSTAPLRALLERHVSPGRVRRSAVKLFVGATNYRTGELEFASNATPRLVDWLMASSAVPSLFPPIQIGRDWYIDGGVRSMIPVLDLVGESWDEAYVILARPLGVPPASGRPSGLKTLAARALEIAFNEILRGDIRDCRAYAGRGLHLYVPVADGLPASLEFDPDQIARLLEMGQQAAAA